MKIPVLNNELLLKKPLSNLTGFFRVETEVVLETDTLVYGDFVFLRNGKLYNKDGASWIRSNLKIIYFVGVQDLEKGFPSQIVYKYPVEITETGYVVQPDNKIIYRSYLLNNDYHNVRGPAREDLLDEHYYIRGKGLTYDQWKNHPEVIEYQSMLALKNKMNFVFNS